MFGFFRAGKRRQEAEATQKELTAAFDAIGLTFRLLDPVIQQALVKEATTLGTDKAMKNLLRIAKEVDTHDGATQEMKMGVLRDIYRERAAKLDEIMNSPYSN
jgi:hypothetical protein